MVKKIEPLVNIEPEGDATEEATTPLPSEESTRSTPRRRNSARSDAICPA